MSIDCMRNRTNVKTPNGYIGRLIITRRERVLIANGRLSNLVGVLGKDGAKRTYKYNELVEVEEVEEVERISLEDRVANLEDRIAALEEEK